MLWRNTGSLFVSVFLFLSVFGFSLSYTTLLKKEERLQSANNTVSLPSAFRVRMLVHKVHTVTATHTHTHTHTHTADSELGNT